MLTVEELTELRNATFANLPDSCRIVSPILSRTAGGGVTNAPSIGPVLACRVTPMAEAPPQAQREVVGRIGSLEGWLVSLPALQAVVEGDQLDVTVAGGATRRLEITSVLSPKSYELSRRVICAEIA